MVIAKLFALHARAKIKHHVKSFFIIGFLSGNENELKFCLKRFKKKSFFYRFFTSDL